jgi:hypothetical protein
MKPSAADEPRSVQERAAEEAIDLFTARMEAAGAEVEQLILFGHVTGVADGQTGVSVVVGIDEPHDMLAFILGHARALARAFGLPFALMEFEEGGQG